jgi:hypothetical protein
VSGSYGNGATVEEPTPTGSVGVYRRLGGGGHQTKNTGPPFSAPPPSRSRPRPTTAASARPRFAWPMARACPSGAEPPWGDSHRVFPASCNTSRARPRGSMPGSRRFNSFVKTGDLTGSWSSSYSSLVPYEEGTTSRGRWRPTHGATGQPAPAHRPGSRTSVPHVPSGARVGLGSRDEVEPGERVHRGRRAVARVDATGPAATAVLAQGRTVAETRAAMYGARSACLGGVRELAVQQVPREVSAAA